MSQNFSHPNAQPFELGMDSKLGKPGVLLIHGFTGSPSHMRPLGDFLAEKGYPVNGILLPGHGLSIEEMERTGDRQWLDAARRAAVRLRERFGKVIVGGLSMGGVISLILGEEGMADGVMSYAAPIRIYNTAAPLSRWVWPVYRYTPWKPTAVREGFLDEYDYGYPKTPVRKTPDLLRLMRRAERNLSELRTPLLIVQSHQDETVKPVSAQMIHDGAVNAGPKTLVWLQRSGHVCTIGPEREEVFAKTLSFLEA